MAKKAAKKSKKEQGVDGEGAGMEEDVDKILAEFSKRDLEAKEVSMQECPRPGPRVNGTFAAHPLKEDEFIFYGGEFFDGQSNFVYSDLFTFNIAKQQWHRVVSPNQPKPRCAHQVVFYKQFMFMFGGEFATPSGSQFKHYKDFWRLDLNTYEWEELKVGGKGPSPRSGHRMALWKNKIFLFGGFYDACQDTRYFNDVYIFDLDEFVWKPITYRTGDLVPAPRSGFQLCVDESFVYLFGGYSRKADKGTIHSDIWKFSFDDLKWEKVKSSGTLPSPRTSFGMGTIVGKKRCLMFGGVYDLDGNDALHSCFYDDIYVFQFESKRWFLASLKKTGSSADAEALRPSPRMNSQISVKGSTVYIYGGIIEKGDKEIMLDDIWSIHGSKLDAFKCLLNPSTYEWLGQTQSDDESDEEGEESDSESDSDDEGQINGRGSGKKGKRDEKKRKTKKRPSVNDSSDENSSESEEDEAPKETMKEYFERTGKHWYAQAEKKLQNQNPELFNEEVEEKLKKNLRRMAFEMAEMDFREKN
eukprot:Nk52_evm60s1073 gene=Nk52_evmTU60s1073